MAEPTLALVALTGLSTMAGAYGQSEAQGYAAAVAERDAMVAKTQAAQTDTYLREELKRTLGTISAIRASSGVGLDSPTTAAVMREEQRVSDRERRIRVANLQIEGRAKEDEAQFRRSAAKMTLFGGALDSLTGMAKIGYAAPKTSST